jgi:hypothetical protein
MKITLQKPSFVFPFYKTASMRYAFIMITGLLLGSVALSYVFEEIVTSGHCISKLSIIFTGNLIYWVLLFPVVKKVTNKAAGKQYFMPLSIGLGVVLVGVNQFIIQQAISLIFKYGFGCTEGITNYCYMLFENNILTSGLIYLIISILSFQFTKNKDAAPRQLQNASEEMQAYKSSITIKNNGIRTQVDISDILYIEARKNTILLFTTQRKHVLYQSLTSFEKELNPECFIKIHRSFLVNKHFIASYTSSANGNVLVKLNGGTELMMTRHYRSLHAI